MAIPDEALATSALLVQDDLVIIVKNDDKPPTPSARYMGI